MKNIGDFVNVDIRFKIRQGITHVTDILKIYIQKSKKIWLRKKITKKIGFQLSKLEVPFIFSYIPTAPRPAYKAYYYIQIDAI